MHRFKAKNYEILDKEKEITKDIIKKCANAYNKNRKFFQKDCRFFRIRIANTESKFKKLAGKFYARWVKGVGLKGKTVAIRSPRLYAECYKKYGGTKDFEALLCHEICHIFTRQLNVYKGPYWFTEGLAMYIAGQVPGKSFKTKSRFTKKRIENLMFYRLKMKKLCSDMYVPHYYAVEYLIKKFGRKKLLKLINSHKPRMTKPNYEKIFKRIYGLSYKEFLGDFKNYQI